MDRTASSQAATVITTSTSRSTAQCEQFIAKLTAQATDNSSAALIIEVELLDQFFACHKSTNCHTQIIEIPYDTSSSIPSSPTNTIDAASIATAAVNNNNISTPVQQQQQQNQLSAVARNNNKFSPNEDDEDDDVPAACCFTNISNATSTNNNNDLLSIDQQQQQQVQLQASSASDELHHRIASLIEECDEESFCKFVSYVFHRRYGWSDAINTDVRYVACVCTSTNIAYY